MSTAIIQFPLNEQEIQQLQREFPLLTFVQFPKTTFADIPEENWKNAEIFFGERLSLQNLEHAHDLRWIHVPSPVMQRLCLKNLEERENILISTTPEGNTTQIAEFVLANVLAFAKNLFQWKLADQSPLLLWDCKWRNCMWSLKGKIFLQIGLSQAGLEIAKQASCLGMKVWGVDKLLTVHPYSEKNFALSDLHAILPKADIVSLNIPQGIAPLDCRIGRTELNLMKTDSILCILGNSHHIDEVALHELSLNGKFRGIMLDASYQTNISPQSQLWSIPNLILTPGVAPRPKTEDREAFKIFRINLRQYLNGNYTDMLNLIDAPSAHLHD